MDVAFFFLSKKKVTKEKSRGCARNYVWVVLWQVLCYLFLTMPHFCGHVKVVLLRSEVPSFSRSRYGPGRVATITRRPAAEHCKVLIPPTETAILKPETSSPQLTTHNSQQKSLSLQRLNNYYNVFSIRLVFQSLSSAIPI
ncbi:hypothetical protein [Mucilaginibacter gynuensis]|uniref:hypothetical protein n=1 Tax=Mucilaginibacter gynuensis TaxID=1302236 RepID=UPI0031E8F89F